MGKERKWQDVRLLSFDLQTVEFAYAADYTVSISCTDQLSPTGGSFELRFSRSAPTFRPTHPASLAPPPIPVSLRPPRTNPHEEAEPYLRQILRHGPLATSLYRLVGLLRDTLPVVVELDHMITVAREQAGWSRSNTIAKCSVDEPWFDTFVKGLGWWRVLYGDLRHALDLRLMADKRIAILDASRSLFQRSPGPQTEGVTESLAFQPIPDFRDLVTEAVRTARPPGVANKERVAVIDIGVVCEGESVGAVLRVLHERVLKKIDFSFGTIGAETDDTISSTVAQYPPTSYLVSGGYFQVRASAVGCGQSSAQETIECNENRNVRRHSNQGLSGSSAFALAH